MYLNSIPYGGTAYGWALEDTDSFAKVLIDRSTGLRAHSTKFGLYAAMGLVTTAIFWVTETGFWLIWRTEFAREAGAVIGLSIGYVTKYLLDRRYVFRDEARP